MPRTGTDYALYKREYRARKRAEKSASITDTDSDTISILTEKTTEQYSTLQQQYDDLKTKYLLLEDEFNKYKVEQQNKIISIQNEFIDKLISSGGNRTTRVYTEPKPKKLTKKELEQIKKNEEKEQFEIKKNDFLSSISNKTPTIDEFLDKYNNVLESDITDVSTVGTIMRIFKNSKKLCEEEQYYLPIQYFNNNDNKFYVRSDIINNTRPGYGFNKNEKFYDEECKWIECINDDIKSSVRLDYIIDGIGNCIFNKYLEVDKKVEKEIEEKINDQGHRYDTEERDVNNGCILLNIQVKRTNDLSNPVLKKDMKNKILNEFYNPNFQ